MTDNSKLRFHNGRLYQTIYVYFQRVEKADYLQNRDTQLLIVHVVRRACRPAG